MRLREGLNERIVATVYAEALGSIAASRHQYGRAAVLFHAAGCLRRSMGMTLDGQRHLASHHRDCTHLSDHHSVVSA